MAYKKVKKNNKTQLAKRKPPKAKASNKGPNLTSQQMLQPGARGDTINPSIPGYRDGRDTKGRTN